MAGPQILQSTLVATASGANQATDARALRMGELATNTVLPDYAEMSRLGWLFTATQALAGVAPGTSGTTTTPALTIWHAVGATKSVVLLGIAAGYVSGTIGAGHIMYGNVAGAAAPTGGTAITAYSTQGAAVTSGDVNCGTGHTTTAMSASTDRNPVLNLSATLATAPAACIGSPQSSPYTIFPAPIWLANLTVGCFYGVTAAGSSPLLRLSLLFCVYPTTQT